MDADLLRHHVAHDIWAHTGGEGECPNDGAYEPCADCLRVIFLPAADAVIETIKGFGVDIGGKQP